MNRFLGLGLGVLLLQPFLTAQAPPTPTDFVLTTDIAARADRYLSGAPCANQALTQDAHVWTVLVQLKPSQIPQGTTLQDPDSRAYSEDNTLYVPVFTTSESTFSVSNGGKKYDGSIQGGWGIVKLRFVNLSLSEVGDVIDLLIKKKDDLAKAFSGAGVNGQVYSVTGTEESEPPKDNQPGQVVPAKPGDLLEAVEGGLNPEAGSAGDLLVGRLHSMETTHVTLNTLESRIGGVVTKRSIPVTMIAKKVVDLTINWANVGLDSGKAKQDVQNLASQGEPSLGEGAAGGKGKESKPIWIVDEPCLQFSVAPVLSAGQTTAAANFRLRYDFLSPKGTGFLKFRGEGDGAGSSNYFQRVAFNSDGGLNKKSSQFLLAFGGTGAYSLTQKNGQYLDEWRAGGKLQIYTPSLVGKFSPLPGAGTTPVINFEAAAAGGKGSSTKTTDFLGKANFIYTSRINARFSLDLNGSAGWSNKARFANHKSFTYARLQARFTINGDWDYVAKYECGRKDPDYRKFCGWQAGVELGLGR